jgi:hypothetical protein
LASAGGGAMVPIVGTVAGGFVGAVGASSAAWRREWLISMASSAGVVTVRIVGAVVAGGGRCWKRSHSSVVPPVRDS